MLCVRSRCRAPGPPSRGGGIRRPTGRPRASRRFLSTPLGRGRACVLDDSTTDTGRESSWEHRRLQTPHLERGPVAQPTGPLAEAVAGLSDRALKKLLGARGYLRGVDYVRRNAVTDIVVEATQARGHVRGSADAPYDVKIAVAPDGIGSQCNCPLFSKIDGHCKHVAALLIAVREQARGSRPRPPPLGQET